MLNSVINERFYIQTIDNTLENIAPFKIAQILSENVDVEERLVNSQIGTVKLFKKIQ